ncbi:unnamed protein product [Cuscuta epithymum]|uniref:Uncharacterized protein n=1 Tax=Cuscuta epithymum TaxID=186058 RepID=A0AAV0F2N9_9ASTE|nr:unnamed protein product [Cuscuta epithymum]
MAQELIRSRETDVAVLNSMDNNMFDIFGRISSEKLSKETQYSSYLVFKLWSKHGYINHSFRGVSRFVDNEGRNVAQGRASHLIFHEDGAEYGLIMCGFLFLEMTGGWRWKLEHFSTLDGIVVMLSLVCWLFFPSVYFSLWEELYFGLKLFLEV